MAFQVKPLTTEALSKLIEKVQQDLEVKKKARFSDTQLTIEQLESALTDLRTIVEYINRVPVIPVSTRYFTQAFFYGGYKTLFRNSLVSLAINDEEAIVDFTLLLFCYNMSLDIRLSDYDFEDRDEDDEYFD